MRDVAETESVMLGGSSILTYSTRQPYCHIVIKTPINMFRFSAAYSFLHWRCPVESKAFTWSLVFLERLVQAALLCIWN